MKWTKKINRYISALKGVKDDEMNGLISKHLLMRRGIQPSEINKLPYEEVVFFRYLDKEMKENDNKMLANELAKIMSKMMGG